jgi:hypothetical protein
VNRRTELPGDGSCWPTPPQMYKLAAYTGVPLVHRSTLPALKLASCADDGRHRRNAVRDVLSPTAAAAATYTLTVVLQFSASCCNKTNSLHEDLNKTASDMYVKFSFDRATATAAA